MCQESYESLLEAVESPDFDIFKCIDQLKCNIDNIGVHHFLVKKLYLFKYSDLEFCIPQFIQLLINFETNSMALTDFLLDLCSRYPHFCLITFWNLQAYVFELKNEPDTYSFHVVRRFINELQNVMFNSDSCYEHSFMHRHKSFRENLQPSLALCGALSASVSMPFVHEYIAPIIQSQGKQQKTLLFKLANFHKTLTRNLTLKNRALSSGKTQHTNKSQSSKNKSPRSSTNPLDGNRKAISIDGLDQRHRHSDSISRSRSSTISGYDDEVNYQSDYSFDRNLNINTKIISKKKSYRVLADKNVSSFAEAVSGLPSDPSTKEQHFFHSMPDLRNANEEIEQSIEEIALTPVISNSSSASFASLEVQEKEKDPRVSSIASKHIPISYEQKVKLLQINYFKKETEFMMSLQNISMRLSLVPKEARLTSLRAELSIINKSLLPSEIDIPQLLSVRGNFKKKYHKILKLSVNEACVLNSAERVPFLLLIEYLNEEMDFDPSSENNRGILNSSVSAEYAGSLGRKSRNSNLEEVLGDKNSSVGHESSMLEDQVDIIEADLGDMSVVAISNEQDLISHHLNAKQAEEYKSNSSSSGSEASSKNYNLSEGLNQRKIPNLSPDLDTSDLSTQMRIAAVMLQQLEKSGQTDQALIIKNRIVESMKALQDKFDHMDYSNIKDLRSSNGKVSTDAGERKLENDFKLSEDWTTKKNRIRQASAYGHLKNWDLCSVIAKNGDDLPQEAFACQLISLISNIWRSKNISVWTKNMKIVITSANAGLVETINNAMSIHSIKKTLTDFIQKDEPKGSVASLKEYFSKIYGEKDGYKYRKAQDNFSRSLAAYSIICYILQIKDRHNGNIMLDNQGHIIHIDFGFLLSNSPGSMGFEAAPFKLTSEYVEVLGGVEGEHYLQFKQLCKDAFRAVRENCDDLINIVDLMQKDSSLPCFKNGAQTSVLLRQRLQLDLTPEECDQFVETSLIAKSLGSVYTRLYDQFQLLTQGIYN